MSGDCKRYLVAGCKPWNRRVFDESIGRLTGIWRFAANPDELLDALQDDFEPATIFFLHWSWRVPDEIIGRYECICFHMTPVPYGRGGSPLQNLIVRGHEATVLSALRMVHEMDAGPVYMTRELSLYGSAEEIYIRSSELSAEMIKTIIAERPAPQPQTGEAVRFTRRTPAQSRIEEHGELSRLYDFIRMLDAEGYPPAFLEHGGFRYEFHGANRYDGRIEARVRITPSDDGAGKHG